MAEPWKDYQTTPATTTPAPAPAAKKPWDDYQSARVGVPVDRQQIDIRAHPGTGFWDQVLIDFASNPDEARRTLQSRYPGAEIEQDAGSGKFFMRQGEERVPFGKTGILPRIGAAAIADAPEILAGTGGAALGFAAGGPPGAIAGAAGGTAAGGLAKEGVKRAVDISRKSGTEVFQQMIDNMLFGGIGEGVGRGITGLPGAAGKAFRRFVSGQTPESEQLTALALRGGAVPPLKSAFPDARTLQFAERFSERLIGPRNVPENLKFIEDEVRRALGESGIPPAQLDAVLARVSDPAARVSTSEASQAAIGAAKRRDNVWERMEAQEREVAQSQADRLGMVEMREADETAKRADQMGMVEFRERGKADAADQLMADVKARTAQEGAHRIAALGALEKREIDTARSLLEQDLSRLRTLTGAKRPAGTGFDAVGEAVQQARRDFGVVAGKIYKRVDQMVGEQPLVPTTMLKRDVDRIMRALPQSDNRTIFHEISDLPDQISFYDAQRLRTRLGELGDTPGLTPGSIKGDFQRLRQSVDRAFSGAAVENPEAIALLRAGDEFYAQGIRKFDDAMLNKMVRDIKTGMAPDVEVVADLATRPGNGKRLEEIKRMVGPATWRDISGAHFRNMTDAASKLDPVTGNPVIDGRKFFEAVLSMGDDLYRVYGTKVGAQMREYGRRLAALDGVISPENLGQDTIGGALRLAAQARAQREALVKEAFATPRSQEAVIAGAQAAKEESLDLAGRAADQRSALLRDGTTPLGEQAGAKRAALEKAGTTPVGQNVIDARERFLQTTLGRLAKEGVNPDEVFRTLAGPQNEAALLSFAKQVGLDSPEMQQVRQVALQKLLSEAFITTDTGARTVSSGGLEAALRQYTKGQQDVLFPEGLGDDLRILVKEAKFLFPQTADMAASLAAGEVKAGMPFTLPDFGTRALMGWIISRPDVVRTLAFGLREGGPVRAATRETIRGIARLSAQGLLGEESEQPYAPGAVSQ